MELDELKAAWNALDARVQSLEARDTAGHRAARRVAKSRLRVLGLGLILQVGFGTGLALLGGSWWMDHWGTTHLVLSAMAVHLYGVLLVAFAIVQIVAWRSVDFAGPVIDVQSRVARLRTIRARAERVLLVFGSVMWLPLGLILLSALGVDVWSRSPAGVWLNLGICGLVAAGVVGAMKRWPDAFEAFAVGGGLQAAQAALREAQETHNPERSGDSAE